MSFGTYFKANPGQHETMTYERKWIYCSNFRKNFIYDETIKVGGMEKDSHWIGYLKFFKIIEKKDDMEWG